MQQRDEEENGRRVQALPLRRSSPSHRLQQTCGKRQDVHTSDNTSSSLHSVRPTQGACPTSAIMGDVNRAALLAVLPDWTLTLSLIFIGCCSNAYYLEQATRIQPACGTLLTFLQFIFTTLQMLPSQLRFRDEKTGKPFLVPRFSMPKIPISRWSLQVAMYFGTTLLNNTAFSFHVPVPVHIIFRSGGLVVSMLAGYCIKGRRYSLLQIVSVLLVTAGVVLSTLATTPDSDKASASGSSGGPSAATYFCGIGLLTAALFLSSLMGLYQEDTYATYGKEHWQEGLFYNHFLSLPLFGLRSGTLRNEWHMAKADKQMWIGWGAPKVSDHTSAVKHGLWHSGKSPASLDTLLAPGAIYDLRQLFFHTTGALSWLPVHIGSPLSSAPSLGILLPILVPALAWNVLTQLVCVNGVNRLTAMCSSLTVTLVLVVRKAVSLAISVLIIAPAMGEEVQGKLMLFVGASSVMLGTLGYALGSSSKPPTSAADEKKQPDGKATTDDATYGKSSGVERTRNGTMKQR